MLTPADIVFRGFRNFMDSKTIENLSTVEQIVKNFDKLKILSSVERIYTVAPMAKRKSAGVSMDPEFEKLAKERAAALGFNFSTYVNQLIRNDLAKRGGLSVQEQTQSQGGKKT